MKAAVFDPTSWHARLAFFYGPLGWQEKMNGTDTCTYIRAVLIGLIGPTAITAAGGLVAWGLGDLLAWIFAMLVQWKTIEGNTSSQFFLFAIGTLAGIALIFFLIDVIGGALGEWRDRRRDARYQRSLEPRVEREPGFVKTTYRALRERYCQQIKFKGYETPSETE